MITDRTKQTPKGDCFIVTGSIGPHYQPKLFRKYAAARKYAKLIDLHEMEPEFDAVIENRWASDMPSMKVE